MPIMIGAWTLTPLPGWEGPGRGRPERCNEVYAGAPHGYSMEDTSAFHPEATERHFRELRDLLDGTLKA